MVFLDPGAPGSALGGVEPLDFGAAGAGVLAAAVTRVCAGLAAGLAAVFAFAGLARADDFTAPDFDARAPEAGLRVADRARLVRVRVTFASFSKEMIKKRVTK